MQSGGFLWTLQTYLYLNDSGFPCTLVDTLPSSGIIISHRDFLDDGLVPEANQLFVCLRADVDRHPYSQLHVVQNPYQAIPKTPISLWESYFIPHWPQPDILKRDPNRGEVFENVTFVGNAINSVSEFQTGQWFEQLEKLGLKFKMQLTHDQWNDYHDTDVILAVRGFGSDNGYGGKPASKLYNAWHAEIPAILGYETAFRAERKSELDYLEATSYEEVIEALKSLKENASLRQSMVDNGRIRARETSSDKMVERWKSFINDVAIPSYFKWSSLPRWRQKLFFVKRRLFLFCRPTYYSLKSWLLGFLKGTAISKF